MAATINAIWGQYGLRYDMLFLYGRNSDRTGDSMAGNDRTTCGPGRSDVLKGSLPLKSKT